MLSGQTLRFNTRGADGSSGNHGAGYGSSGQHGTAAQHAKPMTVTLQGGDKYIQITVNNQKQTLDWGLPHAIHLDASGGNGGHGGYGSSGHAGVDGRDGTNASEGCPGTSGSDGGPGGDGGNGGYGGAGGNGAAISIEVDEKDMDLLGLIEDIRVSAGKGGTGGRGGDGGPGGRGGSGGSSYVWTTTTTHCDSEGHHHHTEESHFMPGGSDGSQGRSGYSGNHGLSGPNGTDGSYQFIVKIGGKPHYFNSLYQLKIKKFSLIPSDDNIIEPEETVEVKDLVVENTGSMPTPKFSSFQFYINNNDWVTSLNQLALSVQVFSQKSHDFTNQTLKCQISSTAQPAVNTLFQAHSQLTVIPYLPRIQKTFLANTNPVINIDIRYPVELSIIAMNHAVIPQEEPPFAFSAKNISSKSIRSEGDDQRFLQVTFSASHHPITFKDETGEEKKLVENTGYQEELSLNKDEKKYISGTFNFSELDLSAYTVVTFTATLTLGSITKPGETLVVQKNTVNVQFAEGYQYNPEAMLTLVVNSEVKQDVLVAWENLSHTFGLPVDIWNVSLYGLNYSSDIESGFLDRVKHKTIVIFNNSFTDKQGHPQTATDYFTASDIFAAARFGAIKTYIMGKPINLSAALIPFVSRDRASYPSIKMMLDAEKNKPSLPVTDISSVVRPQTHKLFTRVPTSEGLIKKQTKVNTELQQCFPERRYFVSSLYTPRLLQKGLFRSTWERGTIEIQRGLDRDHASIIQRSADDFTANNMNLYNIFKLLPFEKKLEQVSLVLPNHALLTKEAILNSEEPHAILFKAILSDLAEEQCVFRMDPWSGELPKEKLWGALTMLPAFLNFNFGGMFENHNGKLFLEELAFRLEVLIQKLPKTRDYLFFCRRNRILSSLCEEKMTLWLKSRLYLSEDTIKQNRLQHTHELADADRNTLLHRYRFPYSNNNSTQDNHVAIGNTYPSKTQPTPPRQLDLKKYLYDTEDERVEVIRETKRLV